MDDILKLERVNERSPIMKASMPKEILTEVRDWIKECRKIKDHPLSELKAHRNVGYMYEGVGPKHNTFQCSIPFRLVEESFWLMWILKLVAKHYGQGKDYRSFRIRNPSGVSYDDEYGIWANFSYKGDDNPVHSHKTSDGFLSGVMYVYNDGQPTLFPQSSTSVDAKEGNLYLWPCEYPHYVEKKNTRKERVSIAFNIVRAWT